MYVRRASSKSMLSKRTASDRINRSSGEHMEPRLRTNVTWQPKLQINEPDDMYEREADRVADQVVTQLKRADVQRMEMPEEEEELQLKPEAGAVQRMEVLEADIQAKKGSGVPLDPSIREPMEQAFGADFSGVNIHHDAKSDQLSRSIQAQAFTTGQDIFFQSGKYDPNSSEGQRLLAHELTHVVQQSGT